jgi:tetratricopeptide (TPR) repeat protein
VSAGTEGGVQDTVDALPKTLDEAAALERDAQWEQALATYDRAFAESRAARDVCGMADATRATARMLRELGRLDEAQEQAELSVEIATRAGLAYEAARAVNILGTIVYVGGSIHEARDLYESALESARELREDELVLAACVNLGVVANIRGELRAAFAYYLESIAAAVRTDNVQASVWGYNNLGLLASDAREWMQADLLFHRALELADELGDATISTTLLLNRAEPLIQVGELDAAEEVLNRAEAMAERIQNVRELAEAARFRALLARRRGDEAGAVGQLARSLLLATRAGLKLERAEALEQMALLHHDAGRAEDARAHLSEACCEFFAAGATRDCIRARELLSAWLPTPDPGAATIPAVRIAGAA